MEIFLSIIELHGCILYQITLRFEGNQERLSAAAPSPVSKSWSTRSPPSSSTTTNRHPPLRMGRYGELHTRKARTYLLMYFWDTTLGGRLEAPGSPEPGGDAGGGRRSRALARCARTVSSTGAGIMRARFESFTRSSGSRSGSEISSRAGPVDEPDRASGAGGAIAPGTEREPSMPSCVDRALLALLQGEGRARPDTGADAADRRAGREASVLRRAPEGPASAPRGRAVSGAAGPAA